MTDEERQKICEDLRLVMAPWPCRIAADEIERLAKDVEFWKKRAEQSLETGQGFVSRLDKGSNSASQNWKGNLHGDGS